MAYHQTGGRARALACYRAAAQVMDTTRPMKDQELMILRAEAAALLSIADHRTPNGRKEEGTRQRSKP